MTKTATAKQIMNNPSQYSARLVHTYRISNCSSGLDMGTYLGRGAKGALDEMAREAGYRDYADCCERIDSDGSQLLVEDLGV